MFPINPGLELDFVGALIPCYNLALITNNLIAGTVDWFLYSVALLSTIVYCIVAIYITYIMFDDENVIFQRLSQVINTPISPYLQNAPIAYCEETNKCIFIDPGDELDKLIQVQTELKLIPEYIFITHGHIDHAGAAKELATKLNLNIIGPSY